MQKQVDYPHMQLQNINAPFQNKIYIGLRVVATVETVGAAHNMCK